MQKIKSSMDKFPRVMVSASILPSVSLLLALCTVAIYSKDPCGAVLEF